MVKRLTLVTLISILLISCGQTIADPRASYPAPPAELITPARTMEPITK